MEKFFFDEAFCHVSLLFFFFFFFSLSPLAQEFRKKKERRYRCDVIAGDGERKHIQIIMVLHFCDHIPLDEQSKFLWLVVWKTMDRDGIYQNWVWMKWHNAWLHVVHNAKYYILMMQGFNDFLDLNPERVNVYQEWALKSYITWGSASPMLTVMCLVDLICWALTPSSFLSLSAIINWMELNAPSSQDADSMKSWNLVSRHSSTTW